MGLAIRFVFVALCLSVSARVYAQSPVSYRLSFPEAQHHRMQVEVIFPDVPSGVLEVLMSRTSPGRYAIHDFARNVYDVQDRRRPGSAARRRTSRPVAMERCGAPRRGARPLQSMGRLPQRHTPRDRRDPRARQHAGRADVGTRPRATPRARHVRGAGGVEDRHAAASDLGCANVHRGQPAVPDGQPDRAECVHAADLHGRA